MRFSYQLLGQSLNVYRKIITLKLCVEPVLDLVRHSLARLGRSEHGTWDGWHLSRCASVVCVTCSHVALQITLSGLSIILLNFATLIYYDPTYLAEKGGATGPPNWVYFTCVFALLLVGLNASGPTQLIKHKNTDGPSGCSCIRPSMR